MTFSSALGKRCMTFPGLPKYTRTIKTTPSPKKSLSSFVGERTGLEQRLVSLIGPSIIADFPLSPDLLHDMCRAAALLFINRSFLVTKAVSVRTTELMRELFYWLPSALVVFNCDSCAKILLWTIFVVGTAALEGGLLIVWRRW